MASIYDLINKKVAGVGYTPEEKAAQARGQQTQSQEPKRLVSDPKAKSVFDAFAKMQGPTRSGAPLAANPLIGRPVERDIEQERTTWRQVIKSKSSDPTNPFGRPANDTDPKLNRPLPNVSPEIRAMADYHVPFDSERANPQTIYDISQSDKKLGANLANRYLDEYYKSNPLPEDTVNPVTGKVERRVQGKLSDTDLYTLQKVASDDAPPLVKDPLERPGKRYRTSPPPRGRKPMARTS